MRQATFRLFISSTFADFQHERRALHERAFPVLERHCRERGVRFQVVDLRWGISQDAQEDNRTLAICLGEVERCRKVGLPPNFVVLLGDRYGWEPPPSEIVGATWLRLMSSAGTDIRFLDRHYEADLNAVPPVWRLKAGAITGSAASDQAVLVRALRRAALAAELDPAEHPEIFASATHQEILHGALSLPVGTADVFAYVRRIEGLPLSTEGASYVDCGSEGWDRDAHSRLEELKRELTAHLAPGHVRHIDTRWLGTDIATDHLQAFCHRFVSDQMVLIDRALAGLATAAEESNGEAHSAFAAERARLFVGRNAEIASILRYAAPSENTSENSARTPLVIVGDGGTGKSALIAEASRRLASGDARKRVIPRFIGAVAGSEDLASFLNDLTVTINAAYGRVLVETAGEFDAASAAFQRALEAPDAQHPLIVLIDALDQLAAADQVRLLDWLPDELPAHVKVILTTREGRLATEARRRFPASLVQLLSMDASDSRAMLDHLLADAGRMLTGEQRALIDRSSPGIPLWTRLAFEEARHWRSDETGRQLEPTVEELIVARIRQLSAPAAHGTAFVSDVLAMIAAARFGLSDYELARALSRDLAPEVWAEFNQRSFHRWDEARLPPILWFRLYADLAVYLTEQRVDGTLTYRFFHREFQDVIARQVLDANRVPAHRRLARVFSEPGSVGLHLTTDVSRPQDSQALRRVMEQPWQLAAAGDAEALAALLDDVGFVAAKCAANRVADLMQDIAGLEAMQTDVFAPGTASWRARLLAWRTILVQGDHIWPAHRILFQLLIEMENSPQQRAQALHLLAIHPPDWRVLVSVSRQRYIDPPIDTVPAPRGGAGIALLASRVLAAWTGTGSLSLIDRTTGSTLERIELGAVESVPTFLETVARNLGLASAPAILSVPDSRDRRRPVSHKLEEFGINLSWQWGGCLAVKRGDLRSEIILGKDDIVFVGETERELFFLADQKFVIARKDRLAQLDRGLFSFNGLRIDGLAFDGDDGEWTHERFNSVVFIDASTCLSFGYSLGGAQRDDVILEIYRIEDSGVTRRAYGITDHDLDLPIWHVCGLSTGAVVLASERYWHTFEWAPPFEGVCDVTMIAGAAVGNGSAGNWVSAGKESGDLVFEPSDPQVHVTFDAPGVYGTMGGDWYAPPGITRLDPDDFAHTPSTFTGIEMESEDGRVTRWYCDVHPHWIFEREGGDFVVFKNSGPVRVAPWNGA